MNHKFTNNMDAENKKFAQELYELAEETNVNSHFAGELEEKLRVAHQPKPGCLGYSLKQISPTLRWVAMMIVLGLVLSWSIKTSHSQTATRRKWHAEWIRLSSNRAKWQPASGYTAQPDNQ